MKKLLFFLLFINASISTPNTQPLSEFSKKDIADINQAKKAVLEGKKFINKLFNRKDLRNFFYNFISIFYKKEQIDYQMKLKWPWHSVFFFAAYGPVLFHDNYQISAINWDELKEFASETIDFSDNYDDFLELLEIKNKLDFCNLYRDESIPEEWRNNYCNYQALLKWSIYLYHKNQRNH